MRSTALIACLLVAPALAQVAQDPAARTKDLESRYLTAVAISDFAHPQLPRAVRLLRGVIAELESLPPGALRHERVDEWGDDRPDDWGNRPAPPTVVVDVAASLLTSARTELARIELKLHVELARLAWNAGHPVTAERLLQRAQSNPTVSDEQARRLERRLAQIRACSPAPLAQDELVVARGLDRRVPRGEALELVDASTGQPFYLWCGDPAALGPRLLDRLLEAPPPSPGPEAAAAGSDPPEAPSGMARRLGGLGD